MPLMPMGPVQPWQRPDALVLTSCACALPIAASTSSEPRRKNQLQAAQLTATAPDFLIPDLQHSIALYIPALRTCLRSLYQSDFDIDVFCANGKCCIAAFVTGFKNPLMVS